MHCPRMRQACHMLLLIRAHSLHRKCASVPNEHANAHAALSDHHTSSSIELPHALSEWLRLRCP
eukprot:15450195-Alexandrium_andersonii.AAC.1